MHGQALRGSLLFDHRFASRGGLQEASGHPITKTLAARQPANGAPWRGRQLQHWAQAQPRRHIHWALDEGPSPMASTSLLSPGGREASRPATCPPTYVRIRSWGTLSLCSTLLGHATPFHSCDRDRTNIGLDTAGQPHFLAGPCQAKYARCGSVSAGPRVGPSLSVRLSALLLGEDRLPHSPHTHTLPDLTCFPSSRSVSLPGQPTSPLLARNKCAPSTACLPACLPALDAT